MDFWAFPILNRDAGQSGCLQSQGGSRTGGYTTANCILLNALPAMVDL
jgi:hypothetical protein